MEDLKDVWYFTVKQYMQPSEYVSDARFLKDEHQMPNDRAGGRPKSGGPNGPEFQYLRPNEHVQINI